MGVVAVPPLYASLGGQGVPLALVCPVLTLVSRNSLKTLCVTLLSHDELAKLKDGQDVQEKSR